MHEYFKLSFQDNLYFVYNPSTQKGMLFRTNEIGMCDPMGCLDFHFLKIRLISNQWKLEDLNSQFLHIISAPQFKISEFLFDYSKAKHFLSDTSNVLNCRTNKNK